MVWRQFQIRNGTLNTNTSSEFHAKPWFFTPASAESKALTMPIQASQDGVTAVFVTVGPILRQIAAARAMQPLRLAIPIEREQDAIIQRGCSV
jgi:hypothetical protein